ncbi:mitochondrial import protein Pam17, partial [Ramicandelaber brevisporus]
TTEASGALSWKEFFELRQRRQRVEQLSMIPGVGGSLAAAGYVLLGMEVDPSQTIMGVDPLAINALCMIGAGGLGFLVGPSLGNLIWKAANKGLVRKMESREDELLRRVVKHRSPSNLHSIRNPIPDYYGENIKSVESYRTWLRRQREHTRRA